MGEDKDIEKHKNKAQLRCIIHMEMLHVMLKYTEVVINIDFIKVSTFPLDLREVIREDYDMDNGDGAYVIAVVEDFLGCLI